MRHSYCQNEKWSQREKTRYEAISNHNVETRVQVIWKQCKRNRNQRVERVSTKVTEVLKTDLLKRGKKMGNSGSGNPTDCKPPIWLIVAHTECRIVWGWGADLCWSVVAQQEVSMAVWSTVQAWRDRMGESRSPPQTRAGRSYQWVEVNMELILCFQRWSTTVVIWNTWQI